MRRWKKRKDDVGDVIIFMIAQERPSARKSEGFLNRNAEWRDFIDISELKTRGQGSERLLRGDVLAPFFQADYFASRSNERGHRMRKIRALLFHDSHDLRKRYQNT